MKQFDDISGQQFGRLVAVSHVKREGPHQLWKCKCECGTVKVLRANSLKTGAVKSCGCLKREVTGDRARTHGMSGSREFFSWSHAKNRCYNQNDDHYKDYGGRGISMCDRWLGRGGFERFIADMGRMPPGSSLERKEVDGDYCPDNCCWIAKHAQARNKRCTVRLTISGETKTLYEWAGSSPVSATTIKGRLQRGWSHSDAVMLPLKKPWSKKRRARHVG